MKPRKYCHLVPKITFGSLIITRKRASLETLSHPESFTWKVLPLPKIIEQSTKQLFYPKMKVSTNTNIMVGRRKRRWRIRLAFLQFLCVTKVVYSNCSVRYTWGDQSTPGDNLGYGTLGGISLLLGYNLEMCRLIPQSPQVVPDTITTLSLWFRVQYHLLQWRI